MVVSTNTDHCDGWMVWKRTIMRAKVRKHRMGERAANHFRI